MLIPDTGSSGWRADDTALRRSLDRVEHMSTDTSIAVIRCRDFLYRLALQIDEVLPPTSPAPIPLERLPLVASLVRDYIEAEVMLAGADGEPEEKRQ